MNVIAFRAPGSPLSIENWPTPVPGVGQVLVEVAACGVCRTDLHIVDGELKNPKQPLVLGHEVVGYVRAVGSQPSARAIGDRVGVGWLGWTCGICRYCESGRENLCEQGKFTGYTLDGGYGEFAMADERFVVPIPSRYDDTAAAPLLCAGLIGYRSFVKAGDARTIGIYGFGAAAHIIAQIAVHQGREVYAFTRPGDQRAQEFARSLGCRWAGDSSQSAPTKLEAAIIFAPVGDLVPRALAATARGGIVVCGGIHMTDIPAFRYELLWGERQIVSVANLTRSDAQKFMELASEVPIETMVHPFPLCDANRALDEVRRGRLEGAAVLIPDGTPQS